MPSSGSGPGEPTSGQPVGQTNSSNTENAVNQATSGANESTIRNSGVRVVPLRTVVSAVPATGGRAPTSLGSMGLIYPVLARVHHGHSGNSNSNRGQSSDEPPRGAVANRQSNPHAATHQQSDVPGADGNFQLPSSLFDQFVISDSCLLLLLDAKCYDCRNLLLQGGNCISFVGVYVYGS